MNTTTAQIHLRIFLLAQGGQSELVQDGEIPRRVTFSDTTAILAEDRVEGPVYSAGFLSPDKCKKFPTANEPGSA